MRKNKTIVPYKHMKQTLLTLFFAATSSVASAYLPYTDTTFRPNPLQKPVSICAQVRQSDGRPTTRLDVFAQLSKVSGIPINIDRQAIQDAGIDIDKDMCLMFCEFPIIGIVEFIIKDIDPDGKLAVFYGNDGLTITAE